MSEPVIFEPHSDKQLEVLESQDDITIAGTGIQWGKTEIGAMWFKTQLHTYTDEKDNFIITSPNYKTLQQSTLPPFLRAMQGYGTFNKTDSCFKMHQGGTVWIRTATEPDSIVGIPQVRAIWGDEAGKYSLYFWQNIEGRAAPKNARILLTTSPYALNWIYTDLIKPKREGKRPDVRLVQANSSENPYFNREVYEKRRQTMDPRRFAMMYGGEWGRMAGLVYDCWDDDQNLVLPLQLPSDTRYYGGIDWGYYPDPFVLKIRAVTTDGRHYGVSEFVKTGLTIPDIVQICKQKKQIYGLTRFYADPSQPGSIEELNRNSCPTEGADNDIRRGIDLHYELIKTRKYKEFIDACPHSKSERETYHYPEVKDLGPDQSSKELLPVDQNNHTMDVDRYLSLMLYRTQIKHRPKSPGDELKPNETRLDFLKRSKKDQHSEKFS